MPTTIGSLLSPELELSLGLLPHAATARRTVAPAATARRVVPDHPRRARFPGLYCFAIEAPVPGSSCRNRLRRERLNPVWWCSQVSGNSPITVAGRGLYRAARRSTENPLLPRLCSTAGTATDVSWGHPIVSYRRAIRNPGTGRGGGWRPPTTACGRRPLANAIGCGIGRSRPVEQPGTRDAARLAGNPTKGGPVPSPPFSPPVCRRCSTSRSTGSWAWSCATRRRRRPASGSRWPARRRTRPACCTAGSSTR